MNSRKQLLNEWGNLIAQNAHNGALAGGQPISLRQVMAINGPRAGALEIHAGLNSGKLLQILGSHDCAVLRQFVPWHFMGEPVCFMAGRYVRVEAGWPDSLAERNIRLNDLGQYPKGGGRWIAGKNELGQTITLGLNDTSPHWLIAGTTGSGKSYAMRTAISQLCREPENSLVLIDGKFGEGLGPLTQVEGLVGPLARDIETIRRALSWAVSEMRHRYETSLRTGGRLIIIIDEVQEICQDAFAREMLRRLVCQGRAVKVHCILGTQHPTIAMFGNDPTIKRNLPGRLALKVLDVKSSEVATGASQPRADYLLGAGDSYCIVPGKVHRAQLAYIPEYDLDRLPHVEPTFREWPDPNPEAGGTLDDDTVGWRYNGTELAVGIMAARYGKGRTRLVQALNAAGYTAGSVRADRLLKLGREVYDFLCSCGLALERKAA